MRITFFILTALFSISAYSQVDVSFSGEINPRTLAKLQSNIEKAASKIKKDAPRIVVLVLNSGGGNLYATLDFVESMKDKASKLNLSLHTRVRSSCESSCTVLFTIGEKRMAGRWSKFGFHSPAVASKLPRGIRRSDVIEEARDRWLDAISKVDPKLSIEVESRALLLDDEMSYVSGRDLLSGYVTHLVK